MGNNKPSSLRFALVAGTGAFFTAVFFSFFSEIVLAKVKILILSLLFLLLIVFVGIIADMVGVATAVAEEKAFHAKAAKKIRGAGQAILLVRHADKVATFANDIIGDICGTVSGALGASIVFQIAAGNSWNDAVLSMAMAGLVAAVTVGGKAAGKRTALTDAERIVFTVGKVLAWLEAAVGVKFFSPRRNRDKRR